MSLHYTPRMESADSNSLHYRIQRELRYISFLLLCPTTDHLCGYMTCSDGHSADTPSLHIRIDTKQLISYDPRVSRMAHITNHVQLADAFRAILINNHIAPCHERLATEYTGDENCVEAMLPITQHTLDTLQAARMDLARDAALESIRRSVSPLDYMHPSARPDADTLLTALPLYLAAPNGALTPSLPHQMLVHWYEAKNALTLATNDPNTQSDIQTDLVEALSNALRPDHCDVSARIANAPSSQALHR